MNAVETRLDNLRSQQPEWAPWLAVVEAVLREVMDNKWDAAVPMAPAAPASKVPLLTEATIELRNNLVRRWFARLIGVASRSGTEALATLAPALTADLNISSLFKVALQQDSDQLKGMAAALGVDGEAFGAVMALLPAPFLQSCSRRWTPSIAAPWTEGYCPICGAWPAFAEVRGIERLQFLRCGRCGSGWQTQCLFCPFCGVTDHEALVSLVPENSTLNSVIGACKRCLGYVKTFTKLQGCPPAEVILEDLASVALDMAAAERGYKRPQGAGYMLNVEVRAK
jgi:FdhE protein